MARSLICSATACSPSLHRLSDDESLSSNIFHSRWPFPTSSQLRRLISEFPNGSPGAFYSHVFPILTDWNLAHSQSEPPVELISDVNVRKENLIFMKIQETETVNSWFRCSPFRADNNQAPGRRR